MDSSGGTAETRSDAVSQATFLLVTQEKRRGRVRAIVEASVFVIMILICVLFAQAIIEIQNSLSEEKVGLMALRERWVAVAAGYGLRGDNRTSAADFFAEYQRFRSRPTFRELLVSDTVFSSLADKAEVALYRLDLAEIRAEAAIAASFFDEILFAMVERISSYSSERLQASRRSFFLLVVSLIALTGGFIFLEKRLRVSNADETRSRAITRALLAAEEGERLRISRELHDAVAQDLAAAKLFCGLANSPDATKAGLLLEQAIGEVREICHGLRPAELDRLGIAEASARLCAELGRSMGVEIRFYAEGLVSLAFEAETEINIYRILQEGLANVRRHSGARIVRVSLRARRGKSSVVELKIEDDGRGPGGSAPGLGRTGMEERARMIGGSFRFSPGSAGGTLIVVTVPVKEKEAL